MLGLVQIEDHVTWTDGSGFAHEGIVVSVTDDALYAEVRELGQYDTTELPTWQLHAID